jgi:AraC-like DNA-binding protein
MDLALWPPILATAGPGGASDTHAHHALHLIVAREGTIRLRSGNTPRPRDVAGLITAPNAPHAIDGTGCDVYLVFIDPVSDVGLRLVASMPSKASVRVLEAEERDALFARVGDPLGDGASSPGALMAWGEAAAAALAEVDPNARTMHPRVRRLLRHLRDAPPHGDTSLPALASIAGLSEGRLVHAFRESMGIPLRPYLLWLKVQRATVAIAMGAPLARAAAQAGFSDAAHMARTFRRMFGMAPSAMREAAARAAGGAANGPRTT